MKRKTYKILSHIPIAGYIVKNVICDPLMYGSQEIESGLAARIQEYQDHHPDVQVTRKVLKEIFGKGAD